MKALTEGLGLAEDAGVASVVKLVRFPLTSPSEFHFTLAVIRSRTSRWIALSHHLGACKHAS
jgi:hypothetical protein